MFKIFGKINWYYRYQETAEREYDLYLNVILKRGYLVKMFEYAKKHKLMKNYKVRQKFSDIETGEELELHPENFEKLITGLHKVIKKIEKKIKEGKKKPSFKISYAKVKRCSFQKIKEDYTVNIYVEGYKDE